jgi:hypothetical protein
MYLYLFEYSCTYPRSTGARKKKKRTKYNVEIITMYNKVRRAYDKFVVHDIAMLRDDSRLYVRMISFVPCNVLLILFTRSNVQLLPVRKAMPACDQERFCPTKRSRWYLQQSAVAFYAQGTEIAHGEIARDGTVRSKLLRSQRQPNAPLVFCMSRRPASAGWS